MKTLLAAIAAATLLLAGTAVAPTAHAQDKGKSAQSKGKADDKGKSQTKGIPADKGKSADATKSKGEPAPKGKAEAKGKTDEPKGKK
jgi:hypothetical protein